MTINCKVCNKKFEARPYRVKIGLSKYCSKVCFQSEHKANYERVCRYCGLTFNNVDKRRNTYCSIKCKGLGSRKNRRETLNKWRKSALYREWKNHLLAKFAYECQLCGKKGLNLDIHHIAKVSDYPELGIEERNGIPLCKDCHIRFVDRREDQWKSYFNLVTELKYMG